MRILIVASDVGPCNALKLVRKELEKQGNAVEAIFCDGQPSTVARTGEMLSALAQADRALIGMSSTRERSAEEMLAAEVAFKDKIPVGIFCNTFGEFCRPWFQNIIPRSSLLFVVNGEEAAAASERFPKQKIVASGNPRWGSYFAPSIPREESRKRLGIAPDEKLILSSGTKEIVTNMLLWSGVITAAASYERNSGQKARVVLSRHPGERNMQDLYQDLIDLADCKVQFSGERSSSDALAGADLAVSSYSEVGIQAACLRIPVIDYVSPFAAKWWENLRAGGRWEPSEEGASCMVRGSVSELSHTIGRLLTPGSAEVRRMKKDQERVFRRDEGSAEMIARTLTE